MAEATAAAVCREGEMGFFIYDNVPCVAAADSGERGFGPAPMLCYCGNGHSSDTHAEKKTIKNGRRRRREIS